MKKVFLIAALFLSVAGYAQIQSASLTASGLTCSMCSKAIYKALLQLPAVEKVDADIEKSSYTVIFKIGAQVSPDALKKAVEGAGFAVARLRLTGKLPKTVLSGNTKVTLQGSTYRFVRNNGKTIEGPQTFTVVDKALLSASEWKRYSKDLPSKEQGVYFVILSSQTNEI